MRLMIAALGVLALLFSACGGTDSTGSPIDGDQGANLDGDAELDLSADGDVEADGDDPDGDADVSVDGDKLDGDILSDGDVLLDGDEETPDVDIVSDGDVIADGDTDADPDAELKELDGEAEAEEEVEVEPLCLPQDDPFEFWAEIASPRFGETPYAYDGEIRADCETHGFLFAGAKNMRVEIVMTPVSIADPLKGRLKVTDAAGVSHRREPVVFADLTDDYPLNGERVEFILPRSGEYPVTVSGDGFSRYGKYRLEARCLENCGRRFTRFPIVLIHGFAGWDTFIGFYNYFYNVEDDLVDRGFDVHTTQVAMFNDSDFRARELEGQLMDILTETGARKLDLIGHSQGGIDSRIFISGQGHGGDVAVLAMVATPNRGTIIGDIIVGNVPGIAQDVLAAVVDLFGNLIGGSENDVKAALAQLSVAEMRDVFNPAHPDDPGVVYMSWTGVSCPLLNGSCRDAHGGEWVNPTLSVTYGLIRDNAPEPGFEDNDGLVPVESARWGEFRGLYNADHWDEIGQIVTGGFDHIAMYRTIADTISSSGF
jgi:triacylglycerol esterase/lipase EstA (alpha/beta hydrolase family)